MTLRTLDSLGDLAGRRVFVRCDFNVPLDGDGRITDDGRVRAALPTLKALVAAGAQVVAASRLGRPKGSPDPQYSLAPVAARLGELLGSPVAFATDTVGSAAQGVVDSLENGQVAVLENLRFNAGETSKDDAERRAFAEQLAAFADVMVSDGFGVVHRKQASVYELAELLPSAAGELVAHEVGVLDKLLTSPERPYTVVLGGSKVSDKLGVIDSLLPRVEKLLIGGGMAYTFLAAEGHAIGKSLVETDQIETAKRYIAEAAEKGVELLLPVDSLMAESFSADAGFDNACERRPRGHELRIGRARTRHRTRDGGAVRRGDPFVEDGVLERPDGRVRVPRILGRHEGRRRGADPDGRPHGRRGR